MIDLTLYQSTNLNLESLNKVISESLEGLTMHTEKY